MNTNDITLKKDELVKNKQKLEQKIYDLRVEQNTLNRQITELRLKIKDLDMVIDKAKIMVGEHKDEIARLKQLFWDVRE